MAKEEIITTPTKWELVLSQGPRQDLQTVFKMKVDGGYIYKVSESKWSQDSIGYEVMSVCFVPDFKK